MAEHHTTPDVGAAPPLEKGRAIRLGETTLTALPMTRLTALMPSPSLSSVAGGGGPALAGALREAGLDLPAPGSTHRGDMAEVLWFARNQWLVIGACPEGLDEHAALTDLSDGWAMLALDGPDARATLARLTSLDLRAGAFADGATARTELRHMMAAITRTGPQRFRVMVFRSMAETAWHDLETALRGAAARRALPR
ncbi:sarcosine oxidase subunit gamma [Pseudooceanicola aestuarii]|uniref:sarcosine oxidase subunit gamma n=1 Tax=Pseudooceanicola aestuarii TaxID=2697319 RepID=UPI0013D1A266|nr:sarcosine oxidase subunit gamma family protein [Pseudooceanicola aestuarii]